MQRLLLILLAFGFQMTETPRPIGAAEKPTQPRFELRDSDRVVLLGNTLVERAQKYGYWETLLTARFPRRNITFRNLGWSGDTVWAESRGLFDAPAKGYQRMLAHVGKLKPTVIFLGYGGNEAYAGRSGLSAFGKQYNRLIDNLTAVSAPGVRFVILSPIRHEHLSPPLPDPTKINRKLALYTRALREIAQARGFRFVDLYSPWKLPPEFALRVPGGPLKYLTNDGMHLTQAGYFVTGVRIVQSLSLLDQTVNVPADGPGNRQRERLRKTIVDKNRLYFYRWRPQNVTYLFLFRKHEQGRNAKELVQFDQLVAAKEKEIARLRQPVAHSDELVPRKK